eukprot:3224456-Amphidinium_carterae.1
MSKNGTMTYDVLYESVTTVITMFRMVAERAVHQAIRLHGRLRKVHREAEQGHHQYYRVNSALFVEPTYLV